MKDHSNPEPLTGILWGMGRTCSENILAIKHQESLGKINIRGITSDIPYRQQILDYEFIPTEKIEAKGVDFVAVLADGDSFDTIKAAAVALGFEPYQIWSYRPFVQPFFDSRKYMSIKKSMPSIFSMNCWGGATYHNLGLEFSSPFINMFESDRDFIKILKKPKHYIYESEMSLEEMRMEPVLGFEYPVVRCDDIILHFNHDTSFDNAIGKWNRRKTRINWDNLFVEMNTENPDVANDFANLPYDKKICFVPFATRTEGLCTVDFYDIAIKKEKYFSKIVVGMALGAYQFYDVFSLIESGTFIPI